MKIDFARPDREHAALAAPLEEAALRVLRSGRYILGEEVLGFEEALAQHTGSRHAVGLSSGTDALVTALHALGIGPGDEVIVGAFGFVAAPEAIVRVGARPRFVDIESSALALDVAQVASVFAGARANAVRAILSVDLFGWVHDLSELRAAAPFAFIVEDAAQALGSTHGGRSSGTFGDIGVFSFFPSKALGAAGDGGACITHDVELADRMKRIRGHGAGKAYAWETRGGNYRLDALQAALLQVKLQHLPGRLARRRAIGERLTAAARQAGAIPLVGSPACSPVFAPLALRIIGGQRNRVMAYLREKGIEARVHYPSTLAACPAFAPYAKNQSFPEAERATRELVSIPCHAEMTDEEVDYVAHELGQLSAFCA